MGENGISFGSYCVGMLAGATMGITVGLNMGSKPADTSFKAKYEGIEDKVNVEYVKPSQVEAPQWKDIDGDGKYEATMKIGSKDYLIRWTGKEKPTILPYSITPAKVEPAKIAIEYPRM